jgi:hypothetical protein
MTSGAIRSGGLVFLPMAFEASRMTGRRGFEGSRRQLIRFHNPSHRHRYIRTLVSAMTRFAASSLVAAMVMWKVAWKVEFHRLLVLFWKFAHVTHGQARARARMADRTDSGICATKKQGGRLAAVADKARIVIRVALEACLCCGGNYIRSCLRRDGVAVRTIHLGLGEAMVFVVKARRE